MFYCVIFLCSYAVNVHVYDKLHYPCIVQDLANVMCFSALAERDLLAIHPTPRNKPTHSMTCLRKKE